MQMEQEEKIIIACIIATAAVLSTGTMIALLSNQSVAAAYLKIHTPDTGTKAPAGEFFVVTGSSVPSNTTRTHCIVSLQTNQHGYMPVTPLGPQGTYTSWQGRTSEPVKVGANQVEGQFQCFTPNTNIPNFTKHLVHNFTGIATATGLSILNTTAATAAAPPLAK
jgi:hypothetical protein